MMEGGMTQLQDFQNTSKTFVDGAFKQTSEVKGIVEKANSSVSSILNMVDSMPNMANIKNALPDNV
jgi:hypothetical protein